MGSTLLRKTVSRSGILGTASGLLAVLALSAGLGGLAERVEGPAGAGKDLEELRRANRPTEVDRAVRKGLKFLLQEQSSNGSFGPKYKTAMTSLALMAFLSCGHLPGESPEGQAVAKGLDYLLTGRQDSDGFFGARDQSHMYQHGITTLLLAEVLGMGGDAEREKKILAACRKALDATLRAQDARKVAGHQGGWRYYPHSEDSDLSATVWQVMALRAAKNSGMDVPAKSIARAVRFVKGCFHPKGGGFTYRPGEPEEEILPSRVSAGILSLQVCGEYDAREVKAGADWLARRPVAWTDPWFYYGIYYYSQAMHQIGGAQDGKARLIVREHLLGRQLANGSWPPPPHSPQENKVGPVYRTSLAILALSVEYGFLPIYQR